MKYYILCDLSTRTYLANIPMGLYKATEIWDKYYCGWYVCKYNTRVQKIFADYLKTVEAWEQRLTANK